MSTMLEKSIVYLNKKKVSYESNVVVVLLHVEHFEVMGCGDEKWNNFKVLRVCVVRVH